MVQNDHVKNYNIITSRRLGIMMIFKRILGVLFFVVCGVFTQSSLANIHAENEVFITKIDEGVWLHTSFYAYPNGTTFPSNGLIVREGQSLTLIDTAWGELQTQRLLSVINTEINLPITKALVTHAHADRASGVDVLEARGIKVYSHPLTQQLTIEQGTAVPNNVIAELATAGAQVKFGSLNVFFPGPGHAMDNIMVWLPDKRILYAGCAVRALQSNSVGNMAHGDIHSWLKITQQLKNDYKKLRRVVPGHGEIGGVDLLSHTEKLILNQLK